MASGGGMPMAVKRSVYLLLLQKSLKEAFSLRATFFLDLACLWSNVVFITLWFFFFREFRSVGIWTMREVACLLAILNGGYGIMALFFGGVKEIPRIILSGRLDSFLLRPKNLLAQLLFSKSGVRGLGDLTGCLLIIAIFKLWQPQTLILILFGILCCFLVLTASRLIINSLIFWLGPIQEVSERYIDSLLLFATTPSNAYTGLIQIVMFTILPAGIVGYLPVELVRDFSIEKLLILSAATALFCISAHLIFYRGLRHYESGSQFT